MDNQTVKTGVVSRVNLAPAAALPLVLFASASHAAIDASEATAEIAGLAGPIAAIGGAVLLIMVGIKAWKMIRRAM